MTGAAGYNSVALLVMPGLIELFDSKFIELHRRSLDLISRAPGERLFWKPPVVEPDGVSYSCGELVIRSASAVEQTFGGITTRLWDDPFEWTLPEELGDVKNLRKYLEVVETTRKKGFEFFKEDSDLLRQIPAPETLKPIGEILIETLDRASHLQGRAFGVAQQFIRLRPHLP